MIKSIRVSGFRAAQDVALDELGKINLFVGPNGTGKTSLLCAAFLFCIEGDAAKLLSLAQPETNETDAEGIDRALSWIFGRDSNFQTLNGAGITVSGQVNGVSRVVTAGPVASISGLSKEASGDLDRAMSNSSPATVVSQDLKAIRESADLVIQLTSVHGNEESSGKLYVSHAHGVFGEADRKLTRLPASFTRAEKGRPPYAKMLDDAQSAGTTERIEQLLRSIDPDILQLKIGVAADGSPVVRVQHKRLGLCPLNALGDGLSAALHFALMLSVGKFKFIMLDEFDASLHVSVLRELASFAKTVSDDGIQLFLTTHRADTVGAFVDLVEQGWDGLRIFQTRLSAGAIKAERFEGPDLLTLWRELSLDLRVPS